MAKIAYANKTQSAPYNAAEWNAQDANEIKESVNYLYDNQGENTGVISTDKQLVESQLTDGDNGYFRSGEISIPVQTLIDYTTPLLDVKISGVYGDAKIVSSGANSGGQTIQTPLVQDVYQSAEDTMGVFFCPKKVWKGFKNITVYTNIIAKSAVGLKFGIYCGGCYKYYSLGSATDIITHGAGSASNLSGVTPVYPLIDTPINTAFTEDDVILAEECGVSQTLSGSVDLTGAYTYSGDTDYSNLGKDFFGSVENPFNNDITADKWYISQLSVILYIPKVLPPMFETYLTDKVKFKFVIEHD